VREGSKYKASNGELEAIFKGNSYQPPPTRVSLNTITARTNSVVKVDTATEVDISTVGRNVGGYLAC
jgi:hypothetical protein